ncbi:MAG: two-component system response regulator [Methylobacter sp.]
MEQVMRILVVDDDAMTRLLIRKALPSEEYQIIEAENGLDGVALAVEHSPDLVLLDIVMPDMDGFACLDALLKCLPGCCVTVPVVMLTGVEDRDSIERIFSMGAADFIHKPISWPLLSHRLRFVMNSYAKNRELRISEERLRLSMRAARQGFYDRDLRTGRTIVNDEYAVMLGYDPRTFEETSTAWLERMHPDDRGGVEKVYRSYLAGELPEYRVEFRQACAEGAWKWLLSIGSIVERDSAGAPLRMLGTHTDIDHLKQNEERLKLMANVFKNSGEGILICAGNKIIEVNQSFTHITGYDSSEVIGKSPQLFASDRHNAAFYKDIQRALDETGYWQGELWSRRRDGEFFPVWLGISTVHDTRGKVSHYIGIFSDITERKAATAKIEYLAHHDVLTHLPNRTLLRDRFEQAVAHATRSNTLVALLFLDLDKFKQINDTLGHDIGDRLLQGIADRLTKGLRDGDSICRQGGDEFIIMLTDLHDAGTVAQIAEKILQKINEPFDIDGVHITTSFSIGISIYSLDGTNFDGLLNKADTAMYAAKKQGRNMFRFFSNDMNIASIERLNMENGLRHALEKGELSLHYQPQYCTNDRQLIGTEALLRWTRSSGESVAPAKFIPVAEDIGLIVPIGDWVLHEACRQNRLWHDAGLKLTVNVNVSAVQFKQGNLVESVQSALASSGLEPHYLELELTETTLMVDIEVIVNTMIELRKLGVTFAIDDFGSGYSSLNYIKRFMVDKLKIDRSFVSDLSQGRQEDKAIVQAIVQMGKALNIDVLAEGVETKEQLDLLSLLGCKNVQGFYLSHPLSVVDFKQEILARVAK